MGFVKEFKTFAMKGNVVDLAVGVVIGTAFGKIVSSLVGDVIMPFVGVLTGGVDFSALTLNVGDAAVKYGAFIQSIVDFLIIATAIFVAVKVINHLKRVEEEQPKPVEPPKPSEEALLLREIRDLLLRHQ